jgi:hypothetical protein
MGQWAGGRMRKMVRKAKRGTGLTRIVVTRLACLPLYPECKLLDNPKGAAGVQAKRTKLKRCVKDTEEEEEEAMSVLAKRTKRERVIPDTDEEEGDKDAASVQVEELKFKKSSPRHGRR